MSVALPKILRENMDKWEYDEDGKMVPVKGASFEIVKALEEMNRMDEENDSDDVFIND